MSAETLRRAATGLRDEWGEKPLGTAWHRERDFHLAVADWLDHAAARAESKIQHGGKEGPVWSHERDALAVAAAYLNPT